MTRKRKPRRRMVHWVTFGFNDGSVIACAPERKLPEKRNKEEQIYICPEQVETHEAILADLRAKFEPADNRVNALQKRLSDIEDRLLEP